MNDEDSIIEGSEELDTSEDTSSEDTQDVEDVEEDSQANGEATKSVDVEESKEEVTSKGTKLDPDPMSRANQLRANAEARTREYESLLNDPQKLENYLKVLKGEQQQSQGEEISLDKVETTEDLQKYLKQEREKDKAEIASVKDELAKTAQLNQYDTQLSAIRKKYPDMTNEQENIIGDIFEASNFVQSGNQVKYEPRVGLLDVADKVMSLSESSRKEGSRQAQTIVRSATAGRVKSGTVTESKADETKMSAEQTIAHRMQQASRKRS
jgi:hypothetical protein